MTRRTRKTDGLPSHVMPPTLCPVCGYFFDAASPVGKGKAKPKPGDFTLCMKCGGILLFTFAMGVVPATDAQLEGIKREEPRFYAELLHHQAGIRVFVRHNPLPSQSRLNRA